MQYKRQRKSSTEPLEPTKRSFLSSLLTVILEKLKWDEESDPEDMDEDDGEENDDEGTDDDMDAREDVAENPEIVWPVSACIRFHLIPNIFCRRTSSLTVMDLRPLETKTMTLAVLVFF